MTTLTPPVTPPVPLPGTPGPGTSAGSDLLRLARRTLGHAARVCTPDERLALAHLGALRVAAAVLAVRAREVPVGVPGRPASVWTVLARVAPELGEWAGYFAVHDPRRVGTVPDRVVDDVLRAAEDFLVMVEQGPTGPARAAGAGRA